MADDTHTVRIEVPIRDDGAIPDAQAIDAILAHVEDRLADSSIPDARQVQHHIAAARGWTNQSATDRDQWPTGAA